MSNLLKVIVLLSLLLGLVKFGSGLYRAERGEQTPQNVASEPVCVPAAPPATGCAPAAPAVPSLESLAAASQANGIKALDKLEADLKQLSQMQVGILVVRNGSADAIATLVIYQVKDGMRMAIKSEIINPATTQMFTLDAGDYLATFNFVNAKASISEDRFTIEPNSEYTINFYTKD